MYPPPAKVMENRDLGSGVFLLRLLNEEIAQAALLKPGCFVMLQTGSAVSQGVLDPMLPRPMSIQKSDGRVFDVLYRIVGLGTGCLSRLEKGDQINVLGPLGNSFSLPEKETHVVLLGGGVGIPPMVSVAETLIQRDGREGRWEAWLGVSSEADQGCWVGFDEGCGAGDPVYDNRVGHATMDGSIGYHGHVVDAWMDSWARKGRPEGKVVVYACGPMVMLRAVAAKTAELGIHCEVSVETMMGCGFGVCMGCVIENKAAHEEGGSALNPYDRWLLVCRKGPVFDAQKIVLDDGGLLH